MEIPRDLAAQAEHERFVWDNLPRNALAHYWHGMLGMTGFRLVVAPTFLPAYLLLLSGSNVVVGLGFALQQFGNVVSPMVTAAHVEHRKRLFPFALWIGGGMRAAILGMALVGWMLKGEALLLALLALLLVFGLFGGAQRVIFQAIFAKAIPIHRRGRLQAWRNMIGGLVAAVLSFLAGRYLIEANVLGNGYSTTFLAAFVLTSLGLLGMQMLLREPEPPVLRAHTGVWRRLRECPALLRQDRDFRMFLTAQGCAVASLVAAPFYVLHARDVVGISGATLGLLSLAYLGADTLMNLVWGYAADRLGFKVPFAAALALWMASLLMLLLSQDIVGFCLAFFGLGAAQSGYMMCSHTMVLEYGDGSDVTIRLALSATAEGILAAAAPLAGGLIAAAAGYPPVFFAAMGFQAAALLVMVFLVKDPRHRRPA